MTEVVHGIHRLRIPLPHKDILLGYVNVYLAEGNKGYLLIDTGWGTEEAFKSLHGQLADTGVNIKDIAQIVCTHIHPDHYGLAGHLKQLSGAKLILHREETTLVEQRYVVMNNLVQEVGRWLQINGVPPGDIKDLQTASVNLARYVSLANPDIVLSGGETVSTGSLNFNVIWTPGHSAGHINLYEPKQKVLISGDHILPTITPNIGLHPQSMGKNPLGDYLNSLNKVNKLDVRLVLPGHEEPFADLKKRVAELLEHHRQRISEIAAVMDSRPKTAYDIATLITWMPHSGGVSYNKLQPLDKRLAVLETVAHLELMCTEGMVNKFSKNGLAYYEPAPQER